MFLIILTALGTADAGCYGYGCGTEGVWISWGSWSTCSSSCGLGSQVRTRSCSQWGGCSGSSQVTQHCQGYGYGCGTEGVWSSWESWSTCSSSCGLGSQVRTRSCSQGGGCSGSSQATQHCQGYSYGCGTGKCTYRGRTYSEGAQIQTAAGCNTCTCLVNGNLSCTDKYCPSVSNCTTVGGPDAGSACIFPFTFDGVKYTKCTTHKNIDGKAWCSTFTDSKGNHVGGQGNWGHCGGVCGRDPEGVRTCKKKRVRRNVKTLSNSEKTTLQQALQRAIGSGKYEEIGNFHGYPQTLCHSTEDFLPKMCCPHNTTDFLPWHRLFMVQMEEVLGEALPYWDWTEDGSVPHLWEKIAAPIKQGSLLSSPIRCPRPNLNTVMRSSSITIHPTDLKKKTKTSFMATTFAEFHAQISVPHNEIHVGMECEMLDTRTAAYDPLFYLHHAYVDKQLAFWQELQKLRGLPLKLENHPDLLKSLAPFYDLRFNNLPKTQTFNRGNETFDYEDNYCYEYDDLKFDGQTPTEFEAANPNQNQTKTPPSPNTTTGQLYVNVGVILPKMAPSGFHQFDLCLAGSCMYAGQMATFGSPSQSISQRREPPLGQRCSGRNYFYEDGRCCTPVQPCGEGEGDCDGPGDGGVNDGDRDDFEFEFSQIGDRGCRGDLVCGSNNCKKFGAYYHEKDDCCEKPPRGSPSQNTNSRGSPSQNTNSPGMVSKKTHYLVEYEVTDLVNEQGWAGSEFELMARLDKNRLEVPAPVVILRYGGGLGSIGTVVINQMREDYGDLLDKFEMIIGGPGGA